MNKLTEVQKQKIKEIVGKIYRDGIAENMTRQDIRINELYELFSTLLQKEREAGKREGIEEVIGYTENRLYDCSGCTDPDSEGTHSEMTKQHYKEMLKSQSVEKGKSDLDDDFEFVGGEK